MDREMQEQITELAHRLILKEPESERPRLLRWAERELDKVGLTAHLTDLENEYQGVYDLIGHNPAIEDWCRARSINPENLLQAETIADLIDWLTPNY